MKILQLILILLYASNANAQSFEKIEDSLKLEMFDDYVRFMLEHEIDSISPANVVGSYHVIYRSGCPYYETFMFNDSGVYDPITETGGTHFSVDLKSGNYTHSNHFNTNEPPKYDFPICLESVEAHLDSTTYPISIDQEFVDQRMGASPSLPVSVNGLGSFEAISFIGGKYLILSSSRIWTIGSQTSQGNTVTYFLERIGE